MFPLDFMRECQNQQVSISLYNGDQYTGILVNCDNWMNVHLMSVNIIHPSQEIENLNSALIRGSSIRFMSMPKCVIDAVKQSRNKENQAVFQQNRNANNKRRGDESQGYQRRTDQNGNQQRGRRGRGGARGGQKSSDFTYQ